MGALPYLAPLFLVFEVWQLVFAERYLGIKQIARGVDPRALRLRERTAFLWTLALFAYGTWMLLLMFVPSVRVYGIALLVFALGGYALRRGAPLKWILVILTIEGAIRVGLLFSLCGMLWLRR